jgi:hypothetical protein
LLLATLALALAGCESNSPAKTCQQLMSDYQAALPAARVCTPGAPAQCEALVADGLCMPCSQFVNDATTLNGIIVQWNDQRCSSLLGCQNVVCIMPGPFVCLANDGGSASGSCGIAPAATTN